MLFYNDIVFRNDNLIEINEKFIINYKLKYGFLFYSVSSMRLYNPVFEAA